MVLTKQHFNYANKPASMPPRATPPQSVRVGPSPVTCNTAIYQLQSASPTESSVPAGNAALPIYNVNSESVKRGESVGGDISLKNATLVS